MPWYKKLIRCLLILRKTQPSERDSPGTKDNFVVSAVRSCRTLPALILNDNWRNATIAFKTEFREITVKLETIKWLWETGSLSLEQVGLINLRCRGIVPIGQWSTSATDPRLVTRLLTLLVERTRTDLSRPSCILVDGRQFYDLFCRLTIFLRPLVTRKSLNPNAGDQP